MPNKQDKIAISINSIDNIAVACNNFKKNEKIIIDSKKIILLNDVNLAHKIACKNFKLDDKIIKFGVTIGLATKDIKIGEHVHLHNMKSTYIDTKE